MAANRKLQASVDRTLKRINEGTAWFAGMWQKLDALHPTEHAGKEKIANEMKKELKKMQRLRDQVRAWAVDAPPPLADRLAEARQAVEHEMERFREVERNLKIRNFSKTGLLMDASDPEEVAREQCKTWVSKWLGDINLRIETWGGDLEDAKSAGNGNASWLDDIIARRARFEMHACKLEQVLRALENDVVTPDDVYDNLRDNLEYLLEGGEDDEDLLENGMYDALPLGCIDPLVGRMPTHKRTAEECSNGDDSDDIMTHSTSVPVALSKATGKSDKKSKAALHAKSDLNLGTSPHYTLPMSAILSPKMVTPPPPPPPPPPPRTSTSNTAIPPRAMLSPHLSPISSPVSAPMLRQIGSPTGRPFPGIVPKPFHIVSPAHEALQSHVVTAQTGRRSDTGIPHSKSNPLSPSGLQGIASPPPRASSHVSNQHLGTDVVKQVLSSPVACSPGQQSDVVVQKPTTPCAASSITSTPSTVPMLHAPALSALPPSTAMSKLTAVTPSTCSAKSSRSEAVIQEMVQGLRKNLLHAFNEAAMSHSPSVDGEHAPSVADEKSGQDNEIAKLPATSSQAHLATVAYPLACEDSPAEEGPEERPSDAVEKSDAELLLNPAPTMADNVLVSPDRGDTPPARDKLPLFPNTLDSPCQLPPGQSTPPSAELRSVPVSAPVSPGAQDSQPVHSPGGSSRGEDFCLRIAEAEGWKEYQGHTTLSNIWTHNAELLQAGFGSHLGSKATLSSFSTWTCGKSLRSVQQLGGEGHLDISADQGESDRASVSLDAHAMPCSSQVQRPLREYSYPKKVPAVLEDPATYRKLATTHPDVLFAAFYFVPGTSYQSTAAVELNRAGWRLHKQYTSWFQRLKTPTHIDLSSERGHVVFFNNRFPASSHPLGATSKQFTPEKRQGVFSTRAASMVTGAIVQEDDDVEDGSRYGEDRPKPDAGWCHMQIPDFTFEYEHLERNCEASQFSEPFGS